MPGFHARLGARLRSEAQGADTVLWLALAPTAAVQSSGLFFQGDFLPGCEGAADPPLRAARVWEGLFPFPVIVPGLPWQGGSFACRGAL